MWDIYAESCILLKMSVTRLVHNTQSHLSNRNNNEYVKSSRKILYERQRYLEHENLSFPKNVFWSQRLISNHYQYNTNLWQRMNHGT